MTTSRYQKRLGAPVPRVGPGGGGAAAAAAFIASAAVLFLMSSRAGMPTAPFAWAPLALALSVGVPVCRRWLRRRYLLRAAAVRWPGKKGLIVVSDSPRVRERLQTEWLPRLGDAFVVFNHSARREARGTLEYSLWRAYCAGHRDYVPAVILLRGSQPPLIFGFYRWLDADKRGHPAGLRALEALLYAAAEADELRQ